MLVSFFLGFLVIKHIVVGIEFNEFKYLRNGNRYMRQYNEWMKNKP